MPRMHPAADSDPRSESMGRACAACFLNPAVFMDGAKGSRREPTELRRGAPRSGSVIRIKRTCEPPAPDDGERILVERLWPRGVKKESLVADAWRKEVAPSTELRKWFGHRAERWEEFRSRYHDELDANPDAWRP